jgi:hypothetical protein
LSWSSLAAGSNELRIELALRLQSDTGDEFPDGEWLDDENHSIKSDNSVNLKPHSTKNNWEFFLTSTSLPNAHASAAREAVPA